MKFHAVFALLFALLGLAMGLKDPICGLPHSADGNGLVRCLAMMPKWTYNSQTNECIAFNYGGCGGNDNRFSLKEECESKCIE